MKMKNNHKNLKNFRVSVITFESSATITYSNNIHGESLNFDKMFHYTGGGTNFEAAFDKAYQLLN